MEDVTKAVGSQLAVYWPDLVIYSEDMPDDFVTPSLYVHRIGLSVAPANVGTRQNRRYSFQAVFFPDEDNVGNINGQLDATAEIFADNLEVIGGKYRVQNLEINVDRDEQVVQATFDLIFHVEIVFDQVKQQSLDYTGGLKDGN